jgi:predicted heme/steroid binding protein
VKQVHRAVIIIASGVLGAAGIVAAIMYVNRPAPPVAAAPIAVISRDALAQHDGVNGHQCYVAVDGTVYLIEGSPFWVDGKHVPSNGRAGCGRDLTQVINESPHGRSKLGLLKVVGRLEQ